MVPSISFSGRECRHADKIFAFPSRTEFSVTTTLPSHLFLHPNPYGSTVKVPELVAVPSGVVIPILPVFAPVGTVAVTFELEFTVKVAALTPPNVTWDALVIPPPMITTEVATFPLVGLQLVMLGKTTKLWLLVRMPVGVVTVTVPVVAAVGTVTVR